MAKQVLVPLTVSLRQETIEKFQAAVKDISLGDFLSNRATLMFENLGDGGMQLTPDQILRIEQGIKGPIASGDDVVSAAVKTSGLEDGAYVFKVRLDPSFIPPMEERAREVGRPVKELISDLVDYALAQGWVYGLEFDGVRRTFTPKQEAQVADLLGKEHFTVDDIVSALKKATRSRKSVPQVEEVMEEVIG